MRPVLLAMACLPVAQPGLADQSPLVVLTYDSFASEWGPGPQIEAAFEATCGCDLRFVTGGDGAALLARVQLEGPATEADVVLGLDTNLTAAATRTGLFAPHGQPAVTALPVAFDDPLFLPFDWGWLAFVHNADLSPVPTSFDELAASDLRIVIQDPRASTPGLGLVLWVEAAYGDRAGDIWAALADNIVTVTPGWSEAYGLFLAGEADMVLSYSTSPAYHIAIEGDQTKAAALFTEGHYLQIEVVGVLASADQPKLAQDFVTFMAGPVAQGILPETNWMYPASQGDGPLPTSFGGLIQPGTSLLLPADVAEGRRAEAIETWRTALSR
jgi:thiamine transport system substrate-binding protein